MVEKRFDSEKGLGESDTDKLSSATIPVPVEGIMPSCCRSNISTENISQLLLWQISKKKCFWTEPHTEPVAPVMMSMEVQTL